MNRTALLTVIILLLVPGCSSHYYLTRDKTVGLYLRAPDAEHVYFASSLDEFTLHPATRTPDRTWQIEIPNGREFKYFYVVDGKVYVPDCRLKETDDFGSQNCIFVPGL